MRIRFASSNSFSFVPLKDSMYSSMIIIGSAPLDVVEFLRAIGLNGLGADNGGASRDVRCLPLGEGGC